MDEPIRIDRAGARQASQEEHDQIIGQLLQLPRDELRALAPSIADVIRVPPSHTGARELRFRMRRLFGGDPLNVFSARGLAVVREYQQRGAIALGWWLRDWRPSIDVDAVEEHAADPIAADDEPTGDARLRTFIYAAIGQMILDGLYCQPEVARSSNSQRVHFQALEARRAAHRWAEELELILKVGPDDDTDQAMLDHVELLADAGWFQLSDLSRLLRSIFALAERDPFYRVPAMIDDDFVFALWTQQSLFTEDDAPEVDAPLRPRARVAPRRPQRHVPLALPLPDPARIPLTG